MIQLALLALALAALCVALALVVMCRSRPGHRMFLADHLDIEAGDTMRIDDGRGDQ